MAFVREDSSVNFYLNDDLIGEYPYEYRGEYFFVRAMNEVNGPSPPTLKMYASFNVIMAVSIEIGHYMTISLVIN